MFDFGGNPHQSFTVQHALPETNIAPESGWLQYDRFLFGWPIFRDYVSVGECSLLQLQ